MAIHHVEIISTRIDSGNGKWAWPDIDKQHADKVNKRLEALVRAGYEIVNIQFTTDYSDRMGFYTVYHTQIWMALSET